MRYLSLRIDAALAPEARLRDPLRLADWCRRFTPLSAPDAPDGAILDITGAAHLFGGEAALMVAMEQRLAALGYRARTAIAGTHEAAWALARYGTLRLAPSDADATRLDRLFGPLPVAALRIAPECVYALSQSGLKRVGDLLPRPRGPLAARFGTDLFVRLDGLMGRAKRPISPRFEVPLYLVERRFAEPFSHRNGIDHAIAAMAQDLARLLERHGEGARQIEARLFRVDGAVQRIVAGTSRPLRDPAQFALLLRERIAGAPDEPDDGFDPGFGFDLMHLAALVVEPLDPRQLAAPSADGGLLADAQDEEFSALVDRLGARLGQRRVMRLIPQATHIPEAAALAVPAAQARGGAAWPEEGTTPALRPIRLFEKPELVEVTAEVPDGPPIRFRWRRILHDVATIEGPERIAPEWWKARAALTRDYFRVEDREGHRFWLFREGLYTTERERPRWFLHGLFA